MRRGGSRRDSLSVQAWLASEGYWVGNILSEELHAFALRTVETAFSSLNVSTSPYGFKVTEVRSTGWPNKLIAHATLTQDTREVTRQFAIELLSEF